MTLIDPELAADHVSIRHRLRAATASLHARVDDHMGTLLQQPDGYATFLAATAAGLLPLEQALAEAGISAVMTDWPLRTRSAALRADLASLSLSAPDTPLPSEEFKRGGEAFLLGALYVLEGSRLGARVILRALEASPSHGQHRDALRYLSHGQGQPLWPTFLAQLEASPDVRRDPNRTCAGASTAFTLFLPRNRAQATAR